MACLSVGRRFCTGADALNEVRYVRDRLAGAARRIGRCILEQIRRIGPGVPSKDLDVSLLSPEDRAQILHRTSLAHEF